MTETTQFTPPHPLNTAILFLVFNRLDTTKQVFQAIRQAKPPRLYVAADGARANKKGEDDKVQAVRDYIMQNIDWKCEVKTLFRDQNMGCKYAVSGAITWFFENEEQGIILEDDCLPSQSFFWYCEELLEKYKNDESIYLVSGFARTSDSMLISEDYALIKYPSIWGWASWRRTWKKYDPEIEDWPNQRTKMTSSISTNKATIKFWVNTFELMFNKKIDTWDYQFTYLLLKHNGKCIVPRLNLVTNIGFGPDATHTFAVNSESEKNISHEITMPLKHKYSNLSSKKINHFYDTNVFVADKFLNKLINKIKKLTRVGK